MRSEFKGRCIDGPLRGQMREGDRWGFRIATLPPLTAYWDKPEYLQDTIKVHYIEYRWVWSLGEWAMVY